MLRATGCPENDDMLSIKFWNGKRIMVYGHYGIFKKVQVCKNIS